MSTEAIPVFIQKEGRYIQVDPYVLMLPHVDEDNSEIYANASLYDLMLAAMMAYDIFLQEAASYSDQDLFDVCKTYDMDYEAIRELVNERRING